MLARRTVLKTTAAGAGLSMAAVLSDPRLASAQAKQTETVTLTTPSGRQVSAALATPEAVPVGAVLLIHEWWGLNDQIKAVAVELSREGYLALAVDLMGGEVADTPEGARALTQAVVPEEATETLVSWMGWLREQDTTTGRLVTMGWCFGGGWSLNASLAAPADGTIIYYGRVPSDPAQLQALSGPVLGHFATQDAFIDEPMVEGFATALEAANHPYVVYWYDADHAFANPTGDNYDSEDARLSWGRTLDFLAEVFG